MKTILYLFLIATCLISFKTKGQEDHSGHNHLDHNKHYTEAEISAIKLKGVQLIFDTDSINGFNEIAARQQASIMNGPKWEQMLQISYLKRRYINTKYNLNNYAQKGFGSGQNPSPQAPCTNVDFELGNASGWIIEEGINTNSTTRAGCCPNPSTRFSVVTPGNDPTIAALPRVPPGGGNFSLRIGDGAITGGYAVRARQTFAVTAANAVFIYKFAVALEDGSHTCNQQPYFNISFIDAASNPIPCGAFNVIQPGSACTGGDPSFIASGIYNYKPWTTRAFDLTALIGQNVTVEFIASDCTPTGHAGWGYIDCSCQPLTLSLNGILIPVGQTNNNMCSIASNTLCATPGFDTYSWTGPGVTGQTGQCVTTNAPGSYSVTLSILGGCLNPVLFSNFTLVPKPIADFSFISIPCQSTFTVPFTDNSNLNSGPPITNWFWDFTNNGTTDNSTQNPTNPYAAPGTYTAELKVSNGGCVDSITKVITITPRPTANYNFTTGCLNTISTFTSTSTPMAGIVSHAWTWGDGTANSMGQNPVHIYATAGTFTVKLVTTNASGCKDSINRVVTIAPNPLVAFTSNTVCLGVATSFNNTSSVSTGTLAYAWDYDNNGTTDNATQNPTNTFATAGTFTVELKATTNLGCRDSVLIPVKVNANPTATFTPVAACVNANVALNNTSSVQAPDILSLYNWTFGAGSTPASSSNQNPPSIVYGNSGVKTITLTVTANTTCTATITKTVTINPTPVANFTTSSVCQSTATAFTDMSTTTSGTINNWAWDFTNDNAVDNTTQNPTFTYPNSGTVTAVLTVSTNAGCTHSVSAVVNIWGHTIPDFSPNNVCFGTATSFTNSTNITTNLNVGTTPTYGWNFADGSGNQVLAGNPAHTYTLGGNGNAIYNVTLTATSSHGCVDVIVKPVNVYAIPTASFTANEVCLGFPSQMQNASNGNGNVVNNFIWDFLSNGTVDATGVSNPNFIFPAIGANVVTYTASTNPVIGLTCSNVNATITVMVNPNPVADFTFVNRCINAQPNSFDASPSSIAVGTNTNYAWAFGDATTGTGVTTTHTYVTASVFNTTLTVTSDKGCVTKVVKQIEVYQKPIMSIVNSKACDTKAMTFTATSLPGSGTATNWFWDYNNSIATIEGNGQTSSFIFPAAGQQTVALITESQPGGCRDTLRKNIYVDYNPVPTFTVNKPSGCPELCVIFNGLTAPITGPETNAIWKWEFGDGTSRTTTQDSAMAHCYNNTTSNQLNLYNIKLTVTTSAGCKDSLTKNSFITVYPTPIASYFIDPNPGSVITPLSYFINQSQDYTSWQWYFGDGPTADTTNVNPIHNYPSDNADSYYTSLIVKNQYGCRDTAKVKLDIAPEFIFYIPNAFTPGNNDGINDIFTGKGIGIEKYEMWIFDRWGAMIFYTKDINIGWDGKVQGKEKDPKQDVFTWKVKLTDVLGKKHDYIGHVTVLK